MSSYNNNQRRAAEEQSRRQRAPVEPKIKTVASASAAAARAKVIEDATAKAKAAAAPSQAAATDVLKPKTFGRSTLTVLQHSTPAKKVMGRHRTTAFQHQSDVPPIERVMFDVLTEMSKLKRAHEFAKELETLQNRVNGGAFRELNDDEAFHKFGKTLLLAYDEHCLLNRVETGRLSILSRSHKKSFLKFMKENDQVPAQVVQNLSKEEDDKHQLGPPRPLGVRAAASTGTPRRSSSTGPSRKRRASSGPVTAASPRPQGVRAAASTGTPRRSSSTGPSRKRSASSGPTTAASPCKKQSSASLRERLSKKLKKNGC